MHQVIEYYQENHKLARETGQRRDEMSALASLGRAYDALEERGKAVEFYEMALKIARDLGDGRAERQTLKQLNEALNPQAKKEHQKVSPKGPKAKSPRNTTNSPKQARKAGVKKGKREKSAVAAESKPSKEQLTGEQ